MRRASEAGSLVEVTRSPRWFLVSPKVVGSFSTSNHQWTWWYVCMECSEVAFSVADWRGEPCWRWLLNTRGDCSVASDRDTRDFVSPDTSLWVVLGRRNVFCKATRCSLFSRAPNNFLFPYQKCSEVVPQPVTRGRIRIQGGIAALQDWMMWMRIADNLLHFSGRTHCPLRTPIKLNILSNYNDIEFLVYSKNFLCQCLQFHYSYWLSSNQMLVSKWC